jgi:hypothetical protein
MSTTDLTTSGSGGRDPGSDEDNLSEIYEKAIQVAIRQRSLVPWMAEDKAMLYDIVPDMSRLIQRIE